MKTNNQLGNLRYDTRSANVRDSVAHGTHAFLRHPEACGRGHEFTPENTRIETRRGKTVRACRKCAAQRMREVRARKRLEASA